jgi:hypothetical protein
MQNEKRIISKKNKNVDKMTMMKKFAQNNNNDNNVTNMIECEHTKCVFLLFAQNDRKNIINQILVGATGTQKILYVYNKLTNLLLFVQHR